MRGDPVRLAQVVSNLLNNAAKYTEEGGRIQLYAQCQDDTVILRIQDNGVGIPSDMLSSIFELFTQVDRSLDRSQGGLGIGLTLVHKLVEMHDGRVEAFSEGPYQGSEFVVYLPALQTEEPPPRSAESGAKPIQAVPASAAPKPPRRRVLIVDDNTDAARSLAMLMEIGGHEVRLGYDGPMGLTEAEKFLPEVVLLDIGLPGMDGLEVARRLRHEPIAATAAGRSNGVRSGRRCAPLP